MLTLGMTVAGGGLSVYAGNGTSGQASASGLTGSSSVLANRVASSAAGSAVTSETQDEVTLSISNVVFDGDNLVMKTVRSLCLEVTPVLNSYDL